MKNVGDGVLCCTIQKELYMRKIFWDNPYQTELVTTVAAVHGDEIVPAATIAFSFCGGQESDSATFNAMSVLGSRMDDLLIWYTLPAGHGLNVGDPLTMTIDWQRRLKLMRLHFAAELVLELTSRFLPEAHKVGAHIAPHKARIDFKTDTNLSTLLDQLSTEYHRIIVADLPIIKDYSDEATQRRFWKIDGFAQVPCGGTHVRSTGEVGKVTLKRDRPGKGIERIEIRLVEG